MSEAEEEDGWLKWFHEQPVHAWMCRVDQSFIEDNFNLYGLPEEMVSAGSSLASVREGVDIILGEQFGAHSLLACARRSHVIAVRTTLPSFLCTRHTHLPHLLPHPPCSPVQTATWTSTWPLSLSWMRARCTGSFTHASSLRRAACS